MDLRRTLLLALPAMLVAGCSSDTPWEVEDEAVSLPATVLSAYRLAEDIALEWSERAYPTRLGGDFAVLGPEGTSRNHSFEFHARESYVSRRLTVQLLSGAPYLNEKIVQTPDLPVPFADFDDILDSEIAIAFAINVAEAWNLDHPDDAIVIPGHFAARLKSRAVWPLAGPGDDAPDRRAWRIDFLEEAANVDSTSLVWWSLARIYLDPVTGEALGAPLIPENGRELYTPSDLP